MSDKNSVSMDDIVSLCKRRGFIFQGSEVYGGLAGTWDYGPLGVQLKKNLMDIWWNTFVESRDDMVGVDAAILMNPKTWKASGHVDTFTDPLVECSNCKGRFRADHLLKDLLDKGRYIPAGVDEISEYIFDEVHNTYGTDPEKLFTKESIKIILDGLNNLPNRNREEITYAISFLRDFMEAGILAIENSKDLSERVKEAVYLHHRLGSDEFDELLTEYVLLNTKGSCPICGKVGTFGQTRKFNLMFETTAGPVADAEHKVYLRPETAQGIFTNFKNVVDTLYPDIPFGIAQQGKAFRNEISPRDFVFRSREFNQMEIEYFIHEENWEELFEKWRVDIQSFLESVGVDMTKIKEAEVAPDDLAHYSKRTIDYEFEYPHGYDELLGLAYRTNFDLGNIERESGKKMVYTPKEPGQKPFVPHVIEPSFGVERLIMAVLLSAYREDEMNGEKRIYLAFNEAVAPVKFMVCPLVKNKPEIVAKAREVYDMMKKKYGAVIWDDNSNVGKRYRRADEIGVPKTITIDYQTLEDNTVTVRDRDTAEQVRLNISELQ